MEISRTDAIWQISLITVIISILSQIFSKKFSISQESQAMMQADIKDLQDRMKVAKGDIHQMEQLNAEMMVIMKEMSKKQMIPLFARSVIFLGFWALLGWIYGDYKTGLLPFRLLLGDGYLGLYFTLSISISILIWIVKTVIKKLNPEKEEKKETIIDHAKVLKSNIIFVPDDEYSKDTADTEISFGTSKKWKQQLYGNNNGNKN
ncbi:MAG: hypothetical protein ACTSXY_11055 [Promethearchaeota archaeon]